MSTWLVKYFSGRISKVLGDQRRIESLDVLRGIAITTVFLTHFEIFDVKGIAIDLFFVLSGFLITKSFLNSTENKKFSVFILKRTTRILPSYYFFLVFGYLLAFIFVAPLSSEDLPIWNEIPQYLFLYRNFGGPPPRWAFEHVWSLCVEEHFYIVLCLVVLLITKLSKHEIMKYFKIVVIFAILLGIVFKIQAIFTDLAEWPTYSHNRMDAFGWGMLLYFWYQTKPAIWTQWKNKSYLVFAGLIILITAVWFDQSSHLLPLRTVAPICWFLIILGLFERKFTYAKMFKIMAFYSYSIYLWHFLLLIPIFHYFGKGIYGFLFYFVSTTILTLISTHLIEDQAMVWRKKLLTRILEKKQ